MAKHESHEEFHDDCAECQSEMEASYREHLGSYKAERQQRESIAIAREDLDMPNADERELMEAIQWRLK